jgi:hypothetical protein
MDSYNSWGAVDKAFKKLIGASKKRGKEKAAEEIKSASDVASDAVSNVVGVISNPTNISSFIPK